jgi:hypothetical protein
LALALVLDLSGCSQVATGVAKRALSGGGDGVAANVQAGRTNAQVLGRASHSDQRLEDVSAQRIEQSAGETGVRAEAVQSVMVRNEAPAWVWLLLIAGWVLPSPGEIGRAVRRIFKRKGSANADG